MTSLDLGVIGNGAVAALVDASATINWWGFPRLDGDPVFLSLINGGKDGDGQDGPANGFFSLDLASQIHAEQIYLPNSAILRTTLYDDDGGVAEITDFAPRFVLYERIYRPPMLIRQIRPIRGRPRLRIRVRPCFQYGELLPQITRGSNHIRYVGASQTLRLTTDAPISYILEERHFLVDQPLTLIIGPDESLREDIERTARDLFERTLDHWRGWVRSLSIPFEWQDAVIRSAITLKLCNFEETGAIVAALTTSIPEAPDSRRNWDYRFCWLRDAYFVIHALNRLGVTRTMENYLGFITNIVDESREHALRPVYGISRESGIEERESATLAGYRGQLPVRIGNQASGQIQNDVYGSVVLAATHAFFDHRLIRPGNAELFERLELLGKKAIHAFDKPDAGPWELRTIAAVHTFSSVMCWAACDRLSKVAAVLDRPERAGWWRKQANRLHAVICEHAWNPRLGHFVSQFDGEELDATLLLLHELNFLSAADPRFVATVEAIGRDLRRGDFLFRYKTSDDFGIPETTFVICGFWYVDALAALGRREEARSLFESMLARRNPLGLLSEDIAPESGTLWGNFPQTYSMVGLVNSAMRLSAPWEDAF
ncbi:glycoside hydrolase family 15 protein [Telmatospirillum siberiense]|uniref:Glucoamylase n=1 Tax=Telmatospirillum siberiense TaxID=382514 RepID=A0A2N3PQR0_9PROT|nr:glycoside hydrolase family 15 protein [Telmatospirillum siberiense]PKU22741.1 glucoamylase [Telmatospirillum siberiense]